jgi:endonuclease YncB( thermonuclease family)
MGNGKSRPRRHKLNIMTINPDEVADIPYQNHRVECRICDVYDGDSFTGLLDFHGYPVKIKIRLLGVDAPEKIPRGIKDENLKELEKRAAIIVRDYIRSLILNKMVTIELIDHDKYGGRTLARVYVQINNKERLLADHLVANGYVRPYYGEKKTPWTEVELLSGPYVL